MSPNTDYALKVLRILVTLLGLIIIGASVHAVEHLAQLVRILS